MKTSQFGLYIGPNAVSIAGRAPVWYRGREYKKLAPKFWFFNQYKKDGNQIEYIRHYKREVLDVLDPQEVFDELGEDAVLLCWEPYGEFCHRRCAAEWFQTELGILVPEYMVNISQPKLIMKGFL